MPNFNVATINAVTSYVKAVAVQVHENRPRATRRDTVSMLRISQLLKIYYGKAITQIFKTQTTLWTLLHAKKDN